MDVTCPLHISIAWRTSPRHALNRRSGLLHRKSVSFSRRERKYVLLVWLEINKYTLAKENLNENENFNFHN